jgi:glycosyltransferase involved in cell wall biosynthesis
MKILVLSKRQYMGKDLIDDRFGRFRELPLGLARLEHQVMGITLSYRRREEGTVADFEPAAKGSVVWHSFNIRHRLRPRLGRFVSRAIELTADFKPDLVWAGSDAYHAIFGAWLSQRIAARCIIDLYDNFEAFRASRIPGVVPLFRRAVKQADGVTCFSQRLAEYIVNDYPRSKPTAKIENGVNKEVFRPRDREECRRQLNLPSNATIIGTAGALHKSRGINTLFQAFRLLQNQNGGLHLALAGPRDRRLPIPQDPNIHDLKTLRHEDVALFINAMDLCVISYRQSAQGQFSFPQKVYEIIACRRPLVAAAVGGMIELFDNDRTCLYCPEDAYSLATAVQRQLQQKTIIDKDVPSWSDSAANLETFLARVLWENT